MSDPGERPARAGDQLSPDGEEAPPGPEAAGRAELDPDDREARALALGQAVERLEGRLARTTEAGAVAAPLAPLSDAAGVGRLAAEARRLLFEVQNLHLSLSEQHELLAEHDRLVAQLAAARKENADQRAEIAKRGDSLHVLYQAHQRFERRLPVRVLRLVQKLAAKLTGFARRPATEPAPEPPPAPAANTEPLLRPACHAPFASLYLNTDGDVIPCCQNTEYVLGNVKEESLGSIWRGEKIRALRSALTAGDYSLGCGFCKWQVETKGPEAAFARIFDRFAVTAEEPEWPSMLQLALGNTCNLACVMCNGNLSSTIRERREMLPPRPSAYGDEFFAELRSFLPHLETAEFLGGEPFLTAESHRVWEMMIADGVVVPIQLATNGTVWNPKVERILAAFPTRVLISVDGATQETVEAIRVGARFDKVHDNIRRFIAHAERRPGAAVALTYCLMPQNWHELGPFVEMAEALGVGVYVNRVVEPDRFSLFKLPPEELEGIVRQMESRSSRFETLPRNGAVWREALAELRADADARQAASVREARKPRRGRDRLAEAWRTAGEGDYERALAIATEEVATHPDSYDGLVLQGRCLVRLGRSEEAFAALDRATDLFPRSPKAFAERAWAYLAAGQPDRAATEAGYARRLLSRAPAVQLEASVCDVLAVASSHAGDHPTAVECAARAVELDPGNAWYRVNRAGCLLRAGLRDEALAETDLALGLAPGLEPAVRLRESAAGS